MLACFCAPPDVVALGRCLKRVASGRARVLVAVDGGGTVVGVALADWEVAAPRAAGVVAHLAVDPRLRRRGIGTALVQAAEETIGARGLVVAEIVVDADNLGARRLYERLGYRPVCDQVGEWLERWPDGTVRHRRRLQAVLARSLS